MQLAAVIFRQRRYTVPLECCRSLKEGMTIKRIEKRKIATVTKQRNMTYTFCSVPTSVPQKRILCVDDEIVGTTIRGQILEAEGYSVAVTICPFEALRYDLTEFDLAVIDFEMPGMNGRELLLRMRALGADFPIILLSGSASSLSDKDRLLFSRCIEKADPIRSLLGTIATFLNPNVVAPPKFTFTQQPMNGFGI